MSLLFRILILCCILHGIKKYVLGTNLRYACTLIIVKTRNSENFYYPYELFQELTEILWKNNVGLSGSLFCLIFDKTSNVFLEMSTDDIIDSSVWLETLKRACSVIKK